MHNDETRGLTTGDRRRRLRRGLGVAGLAVLALPAAAMAFESLNVSVPLMPAVGESDAQACDTDGVTTTYTYGNTSKNGIKVTSATVSGIDPDCLGVTVDFMNGDALVASYTSGVSSTSMTLSTNVFTDTFTSVRVLLAP